MKQKQKRTLKERESVQEDKDDAGHFSSFENLFGTHVFALMMKEIREIARNKYLVFLLLGPTDYPIAYTRSRARPSSKKSASRHSRLLDD